MHTFVEAAQPYIGAIVQAVVGLLAGLVLAGVYKLRSKVEAWLDARTSAAQRDVLHKLAAEAYARVEQQFNDKGGEAKLNAAVDYVLQRWKLGALGIDYEDVKAAVQKAWVELDSKNKGTGGNGSNG